MAKEIRVKVAGGTERVVSDIRTVQDAANAIGLTGNYTAMVNGEAAEMHEELNDYEFVSFAQSVKGGRD